MSSAKNQVEFEAVLSTRQTVFSFTSGHILVCCQNIILVRKFFFCRNSGFIQCHQYIDLHIACSSCVFVRVKRKSLAQVILLIRKRNSHLFLFSVDSRFSRWLVMRAYTEILHIVFLYSFLASLLSFYHYFFPFSIYETFALFFLYNIGKFPKDISSWRQNKTRKV